MEDNINDNAIDSSSLGNVFQSNFISNPLYEMRKNFIKVSPFGERSQMQENRCGLFDTVPQEVKYCEVNKLIRDLENGIGTSDFFFDSKSYSRSLSRAPIERAGETHYVGTDQSSDRRRKEKDRLNEMNDYNYKGEDGTKIIGSIYSIELNPRICKLDSKIGWNVALADDYEIAAFNMVVNYADTEDYKKYKLGTEIKGDYSIATKYVGIKLITSDARAYLDIYKRVTGAKKCAPLEDLFEENFNKENSISRLKWLYEIAPREIITKLKFKRLWKDLKSLLNDDEDGLFSWFRDSSNAIINIVKAISDQESGLSNLYNKFNTSEDDPDICYRLYEHMSGSSVYNDIEQPNKTIFAGLIMAICEANAEPVLGGSDTGVKSPRDKTYINFKLTKGFRVDSNIAFSDAEYGYFNLRQEESYIKKQDVSYRGVPLESEKTEWEPVGTTHSLHPMDMVLVEIVDQGSIINVALPAIYVKDIAFHKEWGNTMKVIRIAVDFLLIITPFGLYTAGIRGFFYILAIVDAAIAASDIVIESIRPVLMKSIAGREFLKNWDTFYLYSTAVTGVLAAPLALVALGKFLVSAGKLVWRISSGAMRLTNQVINGTLHAIYSAIMKSPNFPKYLAGKFEIIVNTASLGRFSAKAIRLQKQGVVLIDATIVEGGKKVKMYYLVYKDVIIAEGKTGEDLKRATEALFGSNGKVIASMLDEFASLKNITDEVLEHTEMGSFANSPNPKISNEPGKMKSGGHGQGNLDVLESLGRGHIIEHEYGNGVRIGSVEKHGDPFKKSVEGSKITGQSWFPSGWSKEKIRKAGLYIIDNNFAQYRNQVDGIPIFDNFEGVRVGIIKTNNKPASIFPDNAKQPLRNSNDFEFNPFLIK